MAAATALAQGPGGQRGFFQAWLGKKLAVTAFQPDDLSDLAGWWDASDASTISLVAGTNRVSQWRDKSGLDRHFTQSDASERPFYDVTQNGLSGMRTAGAEGMNYDTADQTVWRFLHEGKASVFIVMEIIGPQPNTAGPLVVLSSTSLSGISGMFITYDNRSSLSRSDGIQVRGQSGSINYLWGVQNDVWTVDSPQMIGLVIDATNAAAADRLFAYDENNTRLNPDNTETGTGSGDTARDLSFGQESSGSFDLEMKIFELIIYSNTVTEAERGDIISYLSTKWGI